MDRLNVNLSDSEEMILSIILESDTGLTLSQITKRAEERFHKLWKTQTIATFLVRMERKGYIVKDGKCRNGIYYSTISLDEFRAAKFEYMKNILLFKSGKEIKQYVKNHVE